MSREKGKTAVSFRFDSGTVAALRQRARREREAQTELAERYLKEGMRQDAHPLIHFRESARGRRPMLAGSRLDVADVVTTIRQNDNSVEEAAAYLEMPIEQVQAAVAYYADYKEEVDGEIADRVATAQEERARWQRQQEALA